MCARKLCGALGTAFARKGHAAFRLMIAVCFVAQLVPLVPAYAAGDLWEPDDTRAEANPIATNGSRQYHTIDHVGDEDWVTFQATSGVTYVITTLPHADAMPCAALTLYNSGGGIIDTDSRSLGPVSRIVYTPSVDETLYVKAYESWPGATGSYDLAVGERRTVSGTVIADATGLPLAGVTVSITQMLGAGGQATVAGPVTSADGGWSAALDPADYMIQFWPPSYDYCGEYWDDVLDPDGADLISVYGTDIGGVNAGLQSAGSIEGTVTVYGTGAPLPGVLVTPQYGTGSYWNAVGGTMTDSQGHYTFPGLRPGDWVVRFTDTSGTYATQYYEDATTPENADPVTVYAGMATTGVSVAMKDKAILTGTVAAAEGGARLAGIEVGVLRSGSWSTATTTTTGADGSYEFRLDAGTYRLRYRDPSGTYATEYWQDVYVEQGVTPVTLIKGETTVCDASLELFGRIEGTVKSESTTSESFQAILWGYAADNWWIVGYGYPAADGSYSIKVPPGTWQVSFYDTLDAHLPEMWDDREPWVGNGDPIPVEAGEVTSSIDATLTGRAWIGGHVYKEDGVTPLEDVTVALLHKEAAGWVFDRLTTSDWQGEYEFATEPGSWAVQFSDISGRYADEYYDDAWKGYALPTIITVDAGERRSDIDATMELNGHFTGQVVNAETGLPLPGISVRPYAEVNGSWEVVTDSDTTDAEGKYEFDVRPGDWRLRFYDTLGTYAYEYNNDARLLEDAPDVPVGVATTTTVTTAELDRWSHITGTVFDGENVGTLWGVTVQAWVFSGGAWKPVEDRAWSQMTGGYDLQLPKGSYRIGFGFDWPTSYAFQYYDETWDVSQATIVTVGGGETRSAVDARMYYKTHPPCTECEIVPGDEGKVLVTLTAAGTVAGVARTLYAVDGADAQPYTGAFQTDSTAPHELEYCSIDTLGNREATKTADIPDTAAPTIATLDSNTHPDEDEWYPEGSVGLWWTPAPDGSGVTGYSYVVDTVANTVPDETSEGAATSVVLGPYADGTRYFHVRAVDAAGNWGPASHFRFRVDGTAPVGTFALEAGAQFSADTQVAANSSVTDLTALEMRFSANGGSTWTAWQPYAATASVSVPSGDGPKTVTAQYRDKAGNVLELTDMITLDTTDPTIATVSSDSHPDQDAWYAESTASFEWSADPDTSGVTGYSYVVDTAADTVPDETSEGDETALHGGPYADGSHYLHVRAVDASGNWGAARHFRFRVDATDPTGSFVLDGGAELTTDTQVTADSAVTDLTALEMRFSTDGGSSWGAWQPYATPVLVDLPSGDGLKTVMAQYRDEAGNVLETADTITLATAPELPDIGIIRVAGADRYATAIEASKRAYPDGAETVVIATGANWPDALGGSALAGAVEGPLLLTQPGALPDAVRTEIERLGAGEAYILGGTGAVSAEVEGALRALLGNTNVTRLAGADRYSTAKAVADEVIAVAGDAYGGDAIVATGGNYPDALGGSPIAAATVSPILLANPSTGSLYVPDAVESVAILGGTGAVSAAVEEALVAELGAAGVARYGGANRYETAALVAAHGVEREMSWNGVGIATGENFPDALYAGAMLGRFGTVMLLTQSTALHPAAAAVLSKNADEIETAFVIGGTGAVSPAVEAAVKAAAGL